MKKAFYLFFFGYCIVSCTHYPKIMPKDFNFSYTYGYYGEISTFDSTFRRENERIKMFFNKNEMYRVYQTLVANNYWDLPDTFQHLIVSIPNTYHELSIVAEGKKKIIVYKNGKSEANNINKKIREFEAIADTIQNILFSKEEYKNLPKISRNIP